MNILPILDVLSWRSDPKVLVNIQVLENAQEITMTPIDLIACGLWENDLCFLRSTGKTHHTSQTTLAVDSIVKVGKGNHPQNDKITLYLSPVDALNFNISSGDDVWFERAEIHIDVAEKVEIRRFCDLSEELVMELETCLDGKIVKEGDLIEIDFHPDKGSLRENISPNFKDMKDFPMLKLPSKKGYVQIGAVAGGKSDLNCFVVDVKKTAIVKNGLAASRLPRRNVPLVEVLKGNSAYIKISSLVKACFSKKYPLLTVLLHGKQGIGKTTLLETVSESVGVFMVTINFFRFLNDDRTEMIARLELEVEEAMEMTPVIICLDNIDVLFRDSIHKGNYYDIQAHRTYR